MNDQTVVGLGDGVLRVAVVADAPGAGPVGAVALLAQTVAQIADRGIPGCEVDLVVGGEPDPACAYDLVHVWTSGPIGTAWLRAAAARGVPALASYDPDAPALGFYDQSSLVLSPSEAADALLLAAGVRGDRIARLRRGVDNRVFHPARYAPDALSPGTAFNVLHVGDGGLELAAEAFLVARDRDPHLRLVLAGAGPRAERWRPALGSRAVFMPELDLERLASVYASCEMLLATDASDVFGDSILEAQASGLPVLAIDAGAAPELILNGRSGCVVAAEPTGLASAVRGLARRATVLERLATGGLMAIRERSWEASLAQLADVYGRAVMPEVARAA